MMFAFVAVSAVVPSLLLMHYFHSRDRNREPRRTLWITFALGVLSILGVAVVFIWAPLVESIESPWVRGWVDAFVNAALPEEALKLAVLVFFVARRREFDEPIDGLVYGAAASLGFATLENVLYVASGGLGLAVMRALTAVPGHAFSGAILGWYVARWKLGRERGALLVGYLLISLLHGLYDAPILTLKALGERAYVASQAEQTVAGVLVLCVSLPIVVFEVLWARKILLRLRTEQDGPATRARGAEEQRRRALSSSRTADLIILTVGTILASLGGVVALGIALATLTSSEYEPKVLLGGLVMGVPTLLLGAVMFVWGVRRQTARAAALRAPSPAAQGSIAWGAD